MKDREQRGIGVLVGLFMLSTGFIAYTVAPASILPVFLPAFSIGIPAASTSISAVFFTWALLQIPGGFVLDRYDNRRLVFAGAIAFFVASAWSLLTQSYPVFLVTRMISGAAAVFFFAGSINIISRTLPASRRGFGLSLFIASPPVGVALAQFVGPLIAIPYGWRTIILAYTLLAALGFLIVVALLRSPIESHGRITTQQFLDTLGNPSVLLVSLASMCTYGIWIFLVSWMPAFGNEVLGIDLRAAGAVAALVPLAAIVARPGGGWLSDRLDGRLRPVIGISFVASIPLLYALSIASSPVAFAVLLALTGAAVNLGVGLYLVYITILSEAATQGTSLSVLITVSNIGNLAAPVLGGWIIVNLSWTAAFAFVIGLAVVGLVAILLVPVTS